MKKKVDYRQNNRDRYGNNDEENSKNGRRPKATGNRRRHNNFNKNLKKVAQDIMNGEYEDLEEFT